MTNCSMSNWSRVLWTGLVFASISTGCGGGHPAGATGAVEITIVFGGDPVTEGDVALHGSESGPVGSDSLDADGKVHLPTVPMGEYIVTVGPPAAESADPGEVTNKYPNLPGPFHSADTSYLKVRVENETNSFQFDLQDE